jgi:hypothetical protein
MSRGRRRKRIGQELTRRGAESREEFRTVYGWLVTEVEQQRPPGWRRGLAAAIDLGLRIYRCFLQGFSEVYLAEESPGERWVRQALRQRLGFVADDMVEGVLNRIRNRRLHLLCRHRERYQPSLFGAQTFVPHLLRGYLRQVARVESRKAVVRPVQTGAESLEALGAVWPAETGAGVDFSTFAGQLAEFWDRENGFLPVHRLEGLLSLGLGLATGNPLLERRCREWLVGRLPSWERERERLARQISRLLARLEEATCNSAPADGYEQLEKRLGRLRERFAGHLLRLRPRPSQVATMLREVSSEQQGAVRFRRLTREVTLFRRREEESRRELLDGGVPEEIRPLVQEVADHLAMIPPSSRQHGLGAAERQRREERADAWGATGRELLGRARRLLNVWLGKRNASESESRVVIGWLADVENLYELALLSRQGVIGGLGNRHGRRLTWLLRRRGYSLTASPSGVLLPVR